jgi:hypothetical protein
VRLDYERTETFRLARSKSVLPGQFLKYSVDGALRYRNGESPLDLQGISGLYLLLLALIYARRLQDFRNVLTAWFFKGTASAGGSNPAEQVVSRLSHAI